MNLAELEKLRKEKCICGEPALFWRLHEVKCPFFQTQKAVEDELINSREVCGNGRDSRD